MIVIAQSFIDCLTKWAWPKHMRGNAPNHTAWNFNKKLGKTSLMFSTSITFASLTESNWKIRLFPKVLLNWMENFTTIIIYFSEEQLFYRKCIESLIFHPWNELDQVILKWFIDLNPALGLCWAQRKETSHDFFSWLLHIPAEVMCYNLLRHNI